VEPRRFSRRQDWRGTFACLPISCHRTGATAMANLFLFFLAWAFVVADPGMRTYLAIPTWPRKFGGLIRRTPGAIEAGRWEFCSLSGQGTSAAFPRGGRMIRCGCRRTQEIRIRDASELEKRRLARLRVSRLRRVRSNPPCRCCFNRAVWRRWEMSPTVWKFLG